ncbi:phytoene/squalene synthase family protein [Noviherbaspirillum galbum]|uniref:Phytoene/squalene synthase family protein n=1 Tax=Noviherbaspirillum galbum TaxID=2709383 RepID=A0A6B3SG75_9BURK|nr:phytoene/squalene synthase family protein [Noviherbaspirillum galbum]NEX59603.1 phytoene/squalene synthase family protein [Noviherbaspirillum galbum]
MRAGNHGVGGEVASYSAEAIRQGSKSFAKAAMLFDPETRESVMMLYAWCRHCDDVIDGQTLGHGQQSMPIREKMERLRMLQEETARVCDGNPSDLPAFEALRQVLRKHDIPRRYLFELLDGFAMDALDVRHRTLEDTLRYCYHVAGVVGVMMACIMGVRDEEVIHRASDLGIAFQLTNIARDVRDDWEVGRCYLPEEWLARMQIAREDLHQPHCQERLHALACELVELAESYYASAKIGMARLPWRCAWAISSALLIYRDIGWKVRALGVEAWNGRTQVSTARKLAYLVAGCAMAANAVSRRDRMAVTARTGLWTRSVH